MEDTPKDDAAQGQNAVPAENEAANAQETRAAENNGAPAGGAPAPQAAEPADDSVEVVEIADDAAAKHRVWARAAIVLIIVAAALLIFFKSCSVVEVPSPKQIYVDVKAGVGKMGAKFDEIWAKICEKGDTCYSYAFRFKGSELLDEYGLASSKCAFDERIAREKFWSRAERRVSGEARFEYFIALSEGMRIEATQTQAGVPIIYVTFGDLKLKTPVAYSQGEVERVKDGFFIDEEAMVEGFFVNELPPLLAKKGNEEVMRVFACEKARKSILENFLKKWIPGLPWDKADIFIKFDSEKLAAPAGETFQIDMEPSEAAPNLAVAP